MKITGDPCQKYAGKGPLEIKEIEQDLVKAAPKIENLPDNYCFFVFRYFTVE